jgi:predicted nucleic-acid-binding protein
VNGVDTNVLVRYLVQDDKAQTEKAIHFLEQTCDQKNPAFISGIVLCELVWVLESGYGYARAQIAQVIEHILRVRQFHLHEPDILWRALRGYQKTQADFSDHYLVQLNHEYGCQKTVTFDKKAAKMPHAELL